MEVPELLLRTLDELLTADFEKFKWYLAMKVLVSCKPIAKSRLENAARLNIVDIMIQSHGEASAVLLTVEILKKIHMNDVADRLKNTYAVGETAATSTSCTASATPSAPATILAQQSGVVIAPTIINSTPGSLNITINKA